MATFALSVLTYHVFEKPLRKYIKSQELNFNPKLILIMIVLSFLPVIGGMTVYINDGYKDRFLLNDKNLNANRDFPPRKNNNCSNNFPELSGFKSCLLSLNTKEPSVAVLGDSHARHFYSGLADLFNEHGKPVIYLGE